MFSFSIYWNDGLITKFEIKANSEIEARNELKRFLGQDYLHVGIKLN